MGANQTLEIEVENRLATVDKRLDDMHADRNQLSDSGNSLISELDQRVKASHHTLLVAKLISEPARESLFLKLRDSLNDVEELMASQLDGETSFPYVACSSEELADAAHLRPNRMP